MSVSANEVHEVLGKAILAEGYPMVLDLAKSHGQWLYDAKGDRFYLDFFTFYASRPVAFNHPMLREPEYLDRLLEAARCKPSNCDTYTSLYAQFVDDFRSKAMGPGMKHLFFIDGGALAVENALKAAFDWKARKNIEAGQVAKDMAVIHFTQAFHGRSGYTLSLTNTSDPRKTQYFPKFDWPRVSSPARQFPENEENLKTVIEAERKALYEVDEAYARKGADSIAAIIIEPIQAEGGDRHFRPQFLAALRKICDSRDSLLIFDEVQTGLGGTGSMWYYEQLDVRPDLVAFAKKTQTGGIMASERLDEIESVFHVKSRISSTFTGNLVDFVRCGRYLEIIEEEGLLAQVKDVGASMLSRLQKLGERREQVSNVRGVGSLIACDVPTTEDRDAIITKARNEGLLILGCGDNTLRLRPALDLNQEDADLGLDLFEKAIDLHFD